MTRTIFAALALSLLAASPVFAQGTAGGNSEAGSSSNNTMTECKAKLEAGLTDTQGTKDSAKMSASMQQLDLAKAAMAKGDATGCLVMVDKATNARK